MTAAGAFATDVVATADRLYLATISIAGKDEIRVYHRQGAVLRRDTVTTLPSPSPSFKRLEIVPNDGSPDIDVVVSEFQAGQLRSMLFHR